MAPDEKEHRAWRERIEADVSDIKRAVIGDEEIGLTGLVPRMAKMEKWARRLDLRIAAMSGAIGIGIWVIERILR